MVGELIKYIEDTRKKGFGIEEIKDHLAMHGWNEYLVEYAARQVQKREDRKWLQGSVMAVVTVFLLTSGTVWWVNHDSSHLACLLESKDGSVKAVEEAAECCSMLGRTWCERLFAGPKIMDTSDNEVFKADALCRIPEGSVYTTESVVGSCSKR